MIIFIEELLENYKNIKIGSCSFKEEKKIKTGMVIGYMSIVDNFLYFRIGVKGANPDIEKQCRYNISNPLNPVLDNSLNIRNYVASHNLYFFKDKNNMKKCIGGQHRGFNSWVIFSNNPTFKEYHRNTPLINNNMNFTSSVIKQSFYKIYDHTKPCPFYGNGLHLFDFDNDKITCLNNNLPILSGLNEGRCDGFYGNFDTEYKDFSRSFGGVSVFDSQSSILYDKKEDIYFLYQRANVSQGHRSIQYCTSKDLLKWSPFKLIEFGNGYNYLDNNIYYSNFFKVNESNFSIGILPFIKNNNHPLEKINNIIKNDSNIIIPTSENIVKADESPSNNMTIHSNKILLLKLSQNRVNIKSHGKTNILKRPVNVKPKKVKGKSVHQPKSTLYRNDNVGNNLTQYMTLVYSFDYCNFKYLGTLLSLPSQVHPHLISCNHPYVINDKMYFYLCLNESDTLIIYSLIKNRFSYITNSDNNEAILKTKLITFSNNIILNYSIKDTGYIKIQVLDKDNNIIPDYSFDDFDELTMKDSIDYVLSWNKNKMLPTDTVKLEIKIFNANIFCLNGNIA